MKQGLIVFCMSVFALMVTAAHAKDEWTVGYGWKVQDNSPHSWRITHPEMSKTVVTVMPDVREGVSDAKAFEDAKKKHAEVNNCPELVSVNTKIERDPFGKAMAALDVIQKPESERRKKEDVEIIGFEAWDDKNSPRCALVARRYASGGFLVGLIVDDGGVLKDKKQSVKGAVLKLMEALNNKAKAAKRNSAPKQAVPESRITPVCGGEKLYNNWVVTSSLRDAIVYARNFKTLDQDTFAGKEARIGFSVKRNTPKGSAEEKLMYYILVPAADNGVGVIPEKVSLSVDGKVVYRWGKGGEQWQPISNEAYDALIAGKNATLNTTELGRMQFSLKGIDIMLQLADAGKRKAGLEFEMGLCKKK